MELDRKFEVNLDQFNGPLDLLLDLAKSQKVKLENISITLFLIIGKYLIYNYY